MLDVYGTVEMTGFQLTDQPVAGYVLTSDGSGCGSWQPPAGGGDSLWQIGESCILYNGGDVGIGLDEFMWPAAKLEVGGTVKMDGLRLGESATSGYVLTADSAGVGTWQPAGGGGDSLWTSDNEGIHYEDDTPHRSNVGIGGPADASARLYVESDGLKAIHAHATHSGAQSHAFHGEADSTMARTGLCGCHVIHGCNGRRAGSLTKLLRLRRLRPGDRRFRAQLRRVWHDQQCRRLRRLLRRERLLQWQCGYWYDRARLTLDGKRADRIHGRRFQVPRRDNTNQRRRQRRRVVASIRK